MRAILTVVALLFAFAYGGQALKGALTATDPTAEKLARTVDLCPHCAAWDRQAFLADPLAGIPFHEPKDEP